MNKVIFIKRDGPLVTDAGLPRFYPQVFQWLARIVNELDYQLVMITNEALKTLEQQSVISFLKMKASSFRRCLLTNRVRRIQQIPLRSV